MARKSTKALDKNEATEPSIGERKRKQGPIRESRRAATKSKYFEPDTENDSDEGKASEDGSSSAVVESEKESDVSSEELSEDGQRPQKRRAPASSKTTESAPASGEKGKELWRQGVSTGLAPGTQIIIKKPKPRTPGNTPYSDITIHPNTMLFLKDLKANNDREWLKSKCLRNPNHCAPYSVSASRLLVKDPISPHCHLVVGNRQYSHVHLHSGCGVQHNSLQRKTRLPSLGRKSFSSTDCKYCWIALQLEHVCSSLQPDHLKDVGSRHYSTTDHPLDRLITPLHRSCTLFTKHGWAHSFM